MRLRLAALLAVAVLPALASCASQPDSADESAAPATSSPASSTPAAASATPSPTSSERAGANTIEDVWAEIGCSEDPTDPSFGMISDSSPRQGSCNPLGGDASAYFFETGSPEAAAQLAAGGGSLEVGPTDAVFTAGSVVILTSDNMLADELTERFDLVN